MRGSTVGFVYQDPSSCNQCVFIYNHLTTFHNTLEHIRNISKNAFYHLKNIARARPFLSQANAETLLHTFITCRIDCCNALLSGLPKKNISQAYEPSRTLRSSGSDLWIIPKVRTKTHILLLLWSTSLEQPPWRPERSRVLIFLKANSTFLFWLLSEHFFF